MSRGGKISNNNNIDDSNKTNNNNNKIMIAGITEDIIGVTVNKCSYYKAQPNYLLLEEIMRQPKFSGK